MIGNRRLNAINRHVQENFSLYIISLIFICAGVVFGIYSAKYMGSFEKNDLLNYMKSFSKTISSTTVDSKAILIETAKNNIILIVSVWFLGLTMIGLPIILIINLIKGFTVGFSTSFIINGLGIKGIWLSLVGILPQNLIYIPCIIFTSVLAMEFSIHILKYRMHNNFRGGVSMRFASYSINFLLAICIMIIGFFMESYATPTMIKLIASKLGDFII